MHKVGKRWVVALFIVPTLVALSYGTHYLILRDTVPFPGDEYGYQVMHERWFIEACAEFYHRQTPVLASLTAVIGCLAIALWDRAQSIPERLQYLLMICAGLGMLLTPLLLFLVWVILAIVTGTTLVAAIMIMLKRSRNWRYAVIPVVVGLACMAWSYWYVQDWSKVFGD